MTYTSNSSSSSASKLASTKTSQYQQMRTNTWSHDRREHRGQLVGQNGQMFKSWDSHQHHNPSKDDGHHPVRGHKLSNNNIDYSHRRSGSDSTRHTETVSVDGRMGFDGRRRGSPTSNAYHDHSRCEKCRHLNRSKSAYEPTRYCWERYYPISETTPRSSAQSFY